MKAEHLEQMLPLLQLHGRTVTDKDAQTLYFNWTCAGFTVRFTGKVLRAKFRAQGHPWIGVSLDGGKTLLPRFECAPNSAWYTIWESSAEEEHCLRIIKLSENAHGKVGLQALETDGSLLPPEKKQGLSIEFVGDSITCGYGNEALGRDSPFLTREENGWITYAAAAARELNAEFSCVCVSGISVSRGKASRIPFLSMEEIYEFTDYYCDTLYDRPPRRWDFEKNRSDLVVVSLGTNDVNPIRFAGSLHTAQEEEAFFLVRYEAFLQTLRRLNGPRTWICCTLGPLDYYMYDDIEKAVSSYRAHTGDTRISCFKLVGVNLLTEGFGAVGHPSAKTHERMGKELSIHLRDIMNQSSF